MPAPSPQFALLAIGILLLATVVAGSFSSRFGLPALIGFLGLGMLAGVDGPGGIAFDNYLLTQSVGVACLIFILFSGGLDTDWKAVRKVALPALCLATFGVIISAGTIAVSAALIFDMTLLQGALLGAVVASTDAAAVFAILRSTGLDVDGDVPALIEFESGTNDPMAIFLVGAVLLLMAAPAAPLTGMAVDFGQQMTMGGLIGVAAGWMMPELLKRSAYPDGGTAFVIPIAGALVAYGLAEAAGGNGFLAAYVAGLVAGNRVYAARKMVSTFQDGIAWLAQVVMFLTLGLLVTPTNLGDVILPGVAITFILMLVARPLSVFLCLAPFRRYGWREKLFVSWAGLRGAVPIVLATFPIVAGVPGAFAIFNVVFFVVVLSSLIQGPTVKPVAEWLGIARMNGGEAPEPKPRVPQGF
ncbi:K+/H+ antiporter [Polymorphobacter multimanifer]|uniref:Cell volume regulation protein A n=1 Tax=Polymorphobacter multimanifer TaxID=1070431 RepID=A0A841LH18_9SPHN|nr:potassium/proton antiporter [Polymorphobacter multimanifer]MBB6228492.1 cell volume regulation protein A [Polymorphobacter multimanifer]GGI82990.1 K+/H+ antiporter [Polymorphobacter multimanifer]